MKRIKRQTPTNRIFITGLLCFFVVFPAFTTRAAEETVEKNFALDPAGKVMVSNVSGNIAVKTWNKPSVQVVSTTKADSVDELSRVSIEYSESDKFLKIETRHGKNGDSSHGVSVSFDITIPDLASVVVKSISGDITFTSIGGIADAETISGDIIATGNRSSLKAKSISGKITLDGSHGASELKTISGWIKITDHVGSLEGETISGDLSFLKISESQNVKAKSVSGDIIFSGTLLPQTVMSMSSHSGEVVLELPDQTAFDLITKTFSGSIRCDFPITKSGEVSPRRMNGRVGDGGPSLSLSSFSGDITIKKAK